MPLLLFFTAHAVLCTFTNWLGARLEEDVRANIRQSKGLLRPMSLKDATELIRAMQLRSAGLTCSSIVGIGWTYALARWLGWL